MRFNITFKQHNNPKTYRAEVEILRQTDELLQLVVRAGGKELYMDKYPFRKTVQWKVVGANFNLGEDVQRSSLLVLQIQKAIDVELAQL